MVDWILFLILVLLLITKLIVMKNSTIIFVENHIEAHSGTSCTIQGVDAKDIIAFINEAETIEKWDVMYLLKVSSIVATINKQISFLYKK